MWHRETFLSAKIANIVKPEKIYEKTSEAGPYQHQIYRPQSSATRAEVFAFARNILNNSATQSYE